MTLTRFGIREWGSCLFGLLLIWFGCYWLIANTAWGVLGWIIAAAAAAAAAAVAFLFRNPHRQIPVNPLLLVSPADGVVKDVGIVEGFAQMPFSGKALCISIRMSFMSVRLNRVPAGLLVKEIHCHSGYSEDGGRDGIKEIHSVTVSGMAGEENDAFPLAVRQISEVSAQSIICRIKSGKVIKRGEVYGMIKSGGRVEVYLPADRMIIDVKPGDHVIGGESVIATAMN